MDGPRAVSSRRPAPKEQPAAAEAKRPWSPGAWAKCLLLWVGVVVVVAGIVVIIVLCVHGKRAADSHTLKSDLQVLTVTDRPKGDPRTYQHTVLPNGLQVVNVQDEHSATASFAVAVQAGSFDDPKELPGLAHFCEHMLFLGTAKYPDSSGFDDFMSKSGGFDNAYTASEVTVYYAEVSRAGAEEGLDRFADFFRAPLFDERFVKKEVHAIDSEHAKNVQNPDQRVMEVMNSLGNPASPITYFHTGSKATLYDIPLKNGTHPVDALKVYFKNRYCPSMMQVATFGPASVDEQLRLVREDFGAIPHSSDACASDPRNFSVPQAWPSESLGKWVIVKGMQPQAQLWVLFPLPDVSKEYRSQPLAYLNYVLGYGGVDSIQRVLQDSLGLATSSGVMMDGASTGTSLYFVATLTKLGADNPTLVLHVLFSYLAKLSRDGVDRALYETIADISKLNWDWAQPTGPSSTVSDLAERMTRLPARHLLSGDERIDRLNPGLVASLLKRLTPDNMNVAYVNPNASNVTYFTDLPVQTLPHYGVKYAVRQLADVLPTEPQAWRRWLSGAQSGEQVLADVRRSLGAARVRPAGAAVPVPPRPIKDVPKHVALDHMKAERPGVGEAELERALFGPRPRRAGRARGQGLRGKAHGAATAASHDEMGKETLLNTSVGLKLREPEVWYRSGWVTTSPKVTIRVLLRALVMPDEPDVTAMDAMRLGIYAKLLTQEMEPKMVDLVATGVSYVISAGEHGLVVSFGGFAPLLPQLVDTVLQEFNRFNSNPNITAHSRFARIVEEIREDLGTYGGMPIGYAASDMQLLLTRGPHARHESLAVLDNVTRESASMSVGEVLLARPLQLTALAMGNLPEEEAREVVARISSGIKQPAWLPPSPAPEHGGSVQYVTQVVKLARPVEVRAKNPRPGDPNDAVVVGIVAGVGNVEKQVEFQLLGKIVGTLAYTELRTKRQLGYVVNAMATTISNVLVISAMVQGTVLKADEVEAAMEHVLMELMPKRLRELEEKEFQSFVDSLRDSVLQPPMAASEEVAHFWSPVEQGGRCFSLRSEMLQYLNSTSLSRKRLLGVWTALITPADGVRQKLVVKYFAEKVPPRPTDDEAQEIWKKQGLHGNSTALLLLERRRALVLDRADSLARLRLAEEGGYFPQDLNCTLEGNASHES
mmetsp:Transcript_22894/g.66018  ORF Transcript_22894/g.66018 Transcript_22894/m.66018 type:complete len:1164 (-) Transcript_22894:110-3601(-)